MSGFLDADLKESTDGTLIDVEGYSLEKVPTVPLALHAKVFTDISHGVLSFVYCLTEFGGSMPQ